MSSKSKLIKDAEKFERGYAERCRITVDELRERKRVVVKCRPECVYEGCEGFISIGREHAEDNIEIILPL